ncbi:MAG: phage scaffolding protein [Eubacteriales bacterium]
MPKLSDIFGSEKLSYEEFVRKAAEAGGEFGDVAELRRTHAAEMNRLRVSGAVEREALRAGAKNSALLMRVIDLTGVTVDEGGVHGVAEQIGKLRETDPYLFAESGGGMTISTGAPHSRETTDPDLMSDEDYYAGRMKK